MSNKSETANHLADMPRLNRISGQISGVKKMIEENRHCPEILIQLRAVRSAIRGLEANILERHLGHCISESLAGGNQQEIDQKVEELKELFKKYDD